MIFPTTKPAESLLSGPGQTRFPRSRDLDLADAVGSFTRHPRAENLANSTVATYVKALNQLNSFLIQQGMPSDVAAIRREHVEAFLVALQDSGHRPATVANRYRSLQQVFRWLVGEDEIRESPRAPGPMDWIVENRVRSSPFWRTARLTWDARRVVTPISSSPSDATVDEVATDRLDVRLRRRLTEAGRSA